MFGLLGVAPIWHMETRQDPNVMNTVDKSGARRYLFKRPGNGVHGSGVTDIFLHLVC